MFTLYLKRSNHLEINNENHEQMKKVEGFT